MAERLPIDDLLDLLSSQPGAQSPNSCEVQNVENSSNTIVATTSNQVNDNINTLASVPATPPASIRRQIQSAKFLSSSSLKRKITKPTHCKFCNRYLDTRQEVETHLENSEVCLALYQRFQKVNNLDAVMVRIYRCLSCGIPGNFQLKRHLGN